MMSGVSVPLPGGAREPQEPREPRVPREPHAHSEFRRFTATEAAGLAGVTTEQARRLWRALGFPEAGDEAAYGKADVEALRRLTRVMEAALVDFDTAVNLARGVGQMMSRLSEWEVSGLLRRVEDIEDGVDDEGRPSKRTLQDLVRLVTQLDEPFEELLVYVWRRHMRAAVGRLEAAEAEHDLITTQLTVGFADIVSFTALSNTIGEEKVGDLVEVFESRCGDVVAVQRGRVIKSLGDSVLFTNPDPVRAYDTAAGIINVIGRDPRMPDVRVGLASGSVATRLGDVFGPPVNMAARLTAVARRNHIIVDQATADLLPSDQFESRRLPARPVRGFGVMEPVSIRRR
jgi:adenylate cyclase